MKIELSKCLLSNASTYGSIFHLDTLHIQKTIWIYPFPQSPTFCWAVQVSTSYTEFRAVERPSNHDCIIKDTVKPEYRFFPPSNSHRHSERCPTDPVRSFLISRLLNQRSTPAADRPQRRRYNIHKRGRSTSDSAHIASVRTGPIAVRLGAFRQRHRRYEGI
jgi:hypothetical protein